MAPIMPRARVAIHEAGHVVASIALHKRVVLCTIVPEERPYGTSAGHCTNSWGRADFRPDVKMDRKTERMLDREMMILLAGIVAEKRQTGRLPRNWAQERDVTCAPNLALYRTDSEEEGVGRYFQWMLWRTHDLFAQPCVWPCVESLAQALLVEKTMTQRRIYAVVREARHRALGGTLPIPCPLALIQEEVTPIDHALLQGKAPGC